MIAQFVCTSTQALDPAVLKITGTSPLTLLLYLQTRVDYGSGERTLAYDHAQAAGALGIDERTIRRYFRRLVEAGLVVARRLAHGVTFGIARQPAAPPERTDVSVHFHVRTPPERTDVSADERTDVSVQPSRGENPDSESTNQRAAVGGGGPVVGGPTALAPPLAVTPAERFSEETEAAVRRGEEAREQRFTPEVRRAVSYKLDALPVGGRWAALEGALSVIADHPRWNQEAPATWTGQIEKAAVGPRLRRSQPKTQGDYWMAQVLQAKGATPHGAR